MQRLLFIILIFLSNNIIYSQYSVAFQQNYPKRFATLDSIFNHRIIGTDKQGKNNELALFEKIAKSNDDEKAVLFTQLLKFAYIKNDSIYLEKDALDICNNLIKKSQAYNFPGLEALIYLNLGHYYYDNLNNKSVGLYYYLKSHKIYIDLSSEEYHLKGLSLESLANNFYNLNDNVRAINFGKEALNENQKEHSIMFLRNLVALSYYKTKQYDSAFIYYNKVLEISNSLNKRNRFLGWQGIVEGNMGFCYYELNKFDSAISFLKKAIDTTLKYKILDNTCGFATKLCDIYLKQNNTSIGQYLPIAISTTQNNGGDFDRYNLYYLLKNYHQKNGNNTAALAYSDSVLKYKNIIVENDGQKLELETQLKYETSLKDEETSNLNKEISTNKIFKVIAIAFIILIMLIALLLFNRQKLKHKIFQEQSEAKEKEIENELILASTKLEEFATIINEKNKLLEVIEQKALENNNEEYILQLQTNVILTDEQWNSFKELFEKVHKGYLSKLKNKIPDITPAEVRLMALAKLNLTNKEMANSLGVSTIAIRTAWYRLRDKLGMSKDSTLNELVQSIE